MCGIVGYIGHREATPILLSGLKRLEYRGYDSAGLALLEELPRAIASNGHSTELVSGTQLVIEKCKGKVTDLEELAGKKAHHSTIGIGHTRWATHGAPSDVNAHPHTDQSGKIAVIHNGIIENYTQIKARLDLRIIFDDAVVNDGDLSSLVGVRVRIDVTRRTVRGPTGVTNADS